MAGYKGLSCEACISGYRRVNNTIFGGICEKCDCNSHVESCDPFTGKCGVSKTQLVKKISIYRF